jgi:hypothetical protein
MEKIENRSLIKVCTALHQTQVETHQQLIKVYEDSAYSESQTQRWAAVFRAGRDNVNDQYRSRAPITKFKREF